MENVVARPTQIDSATSDAVSLSPHRPHPLQPPHHPPRTPSGAMPPASNGPQAPRDPRGGDRADASASLAPAWWRHSRPSRWNPWLIALTALAGLWQWFGLGWALRHWGDAAAWTLLPILLLTPMHWGLVHESIHGQLRLKARANERTGRMLALLLGLPYEIMRFGHLVHHRFTRQPYDRPDISTLPYHASTAARVRAWLGYQSRLLGGMWLAECFAPLVAWVPARRLPSLALKALGSDAQDEDVRRRAVMFASDPVRRRRIRREFAALLTALSLALWAYGPWWPVFVAAFAARGVWLSIADNLPHYGVAMDEPARARNFRASAFTRALLLNQHLHRVHHRYPTAPWHRLPAIDAAEPSPGPTIPYWRAIFRQFGSPLPPGTLEPSGAGPLVGQPAGTSVH